MALGDNSTVNGSASCNKDVLGTPAICCAYKHAQKKRKIEGEKETYTENTFCRFSVTLAPDIQ